MTFRVAICSLGRRRPSLLVLCPAAFTNLYRQGLSAGRRLLYIACQLSHPLLPRPLTMVYFDNLPTTASSSRSPSPPHPGTRDTPPAPSARSSFRRTTSTLKIERYVGQQAITISREMSPTLPNHMASEFRAPTFPLSHASRQKPRKSVPSSPVTRSLAAHARLTLCRWPLAFRFIKGAVHHVIIVPILLHALFAALIVYLDQNLHFNLGLPSSIVPSLSIVVGLMLVFRNSSSYDRYWGGRQGIQTIVTSVRNLTRSFLVCGPLGRDGDRDETEKTVRCLVAILYAVKNYLRGNWGIAGCDPAFSDLLPRGMKGHESEGLGMPLELCCVIEKYIKRGVNRGAFNAPQSAMLSGQVNSLLTAFGSMETIKLTPIPVCHQIHQKQVLALYCCVLPFCLVGELGWWSIPVIVMVCFTLYGIEGIGEELEDPFGDNKNDIRMDEIIEDVRAEVMVMLRGFRNGEGIFYHGDE